MDGHGLTDESRARNGCAWKARTREESNAWRAAIVRHETAIRFRSQRLLSRMNFLHSREAAAQVTASQFQDPIVDGAAAPCAHAPKAAQPRQQQAVRTPATRADRRHVRIAASVTFLVRPNVAGQSFWFTTAPETLPLSASCCRHGAVGKGDVDLMSPLTRLRRRSVWAGLS